MYRQLKYMNPYVVSLCRWVAWSDFGDNPAGTDEVFAEGIHDSPNMPKQRTHSVLVYLLCRVS